MTNTKTVLSVVASFAASAMLIPSIRSQIHSYVCSNLHGLSHHFSSQITFVIEEFYFQELFMAVDTYLGTKLTASVGRLPYILQQAEAIKEENEIRKINMLQGLTWTSSTEFHHPMTFSTIAMDAELKQAVLDDLNTFMNSKEYYKRIGKAWKRTYLIHGPPGIGKSSLIAAIANHLNYNIYQVDLSYFQKGDDIRDLLLHYITRSLLVIRDIDSPIKPGYQETEAEPRIEAQKQAQLLKVLRLIDGLWLPRGNELIIIFTTNHRERIAPELLTPGRIDMQIPMSYCTISTFNELVYMYYSVIFCKPPKEIEQLLEKVKVTPAEVVGELTRSSDDTDFLVRLTKFLQEKQLENIAFSPTK